MVTSIGEAWILNADIICLEFSVSIQVISSGVVPSLRTLSAMSLSDCFIEDPALIWLLFANLLFGRC